MRKLVELLFCGIWRKFKAGLHPAAEIFREIVALLDVSDDGGNNIGALCDDRIFLECVRARHVTRMGGNQPGAPVVIEDKKFARMLALESGDHVRV